MEITFQGIIVHTTIKKNNKNQQVAVLLNAPEHKAKLAYNLADDPNSGGGSGNDCVDLSGCVTTDAGVGLAARVEIDDIPMLTNTTTGGLGDASKDLMNCPPTSGQIAAIVFLPPGGKLTCDHYFDYEVDFGNTRYGPMPETVTYAVKLTSNIKIQYGLGVLELYPGAKIYITNVCPPVGGQHYHYQYYKNFFQTPGAVTVDDPALNGTSCTFASRPDPMPACTGGATLDVDCVNSRFP